MAGSLRAISRTGRHLQHVAGAPQHVVLHDVRRSLIIPLCLRPYHGKEDMSAAALLLVLATRVVAVQLTLVKGHQQDAVSSRLKVSGIQQRRQLLRQVYVGVTAGILRSGGNHHCALR